MSKLFARIVGVAALVAAFSVLSSCSSSEVWVDREFDQVSFERMWAVSQSALAASDYRVGQARREQGEMESQWRFSPWMFANDAWRKNRESLRQPRRFRAHIKLHEEGLGKWNVAVRVERQRNTDMVDPSNEARASWYSEADDEEKAQAILFRIENSIRVWTDAPVITAPTSDVAPEGL